MIRSRLDVELLYANNAEIVRLHNFHKRHIYQFSEEMHWMNVEKFRM